MLLLLGITTSITTTFFRCLLINTMSGWLAITSFSVWIWETHRIPARSFLTTLGGVVHSDSGTSSPYSVQMFLDTIPATWLRHFLYAVPACILHLAIMCWTVSASLHSLHLGYPVPIDLVLSACSCAAMISASVLSFIPAFSSHK